MSLINDALKRAQEAQRPNTPSGATSIRTIDTRPQVRPLTSRLLVVAIFLLLSGAFAFIGLAMTGRLAKKNGVVPPIAAARPVAAPTASGQAVPTATPIVATTPVAVAPSQPAALPAPKPEPVAAPVVVVPPPPPLVLPESLHVQGVAYDPVRPWAIVSGRTVYIGDVVKGVRVMEITRESVTFGRDGQTKLLYVGD